MSVEFRPNKAPIDLNRYNADIGLEGQRQRAQARGTMDRWGLASGMPQAPKKMVEAQAKACCRQIEAGIRSNLKELGGAFQADAILKGIQVDPDAKKDPRLTSASQIAKWLDARTSKKEAGVRGLPTIEALWSQNERAHGTVTAQLLDDQKLLRDILNSPPYNARGNAVRPHLAALERQVSLLLETDTVMTPQQQLLNKPSLLNEKFGKIGRLAGALGLVGGGVLYAIGRKTLFNFGTIATLGGAYALVNPGVLAPAVRQRLNDMRFANSPIFQELVKPLQGPGGGKIIDALSGKKGSDALLKLQVRKAVGKVDPKTGLAKIHPLTDDEFKRLKKDLAPNEGDAAHRMFRTYDRNQVGQLLSVMQDIRYQKQAVADVKELVTMGAVPSLKLPAEIASTPPEATSS